MLRAGILPTKRGNFASGTILVELLVDFLLSGLAVHLICQVKKTLIGQILKTNPLRS